jgi:thiamine biosynthesis protein ThiS
MIRAQPQQNYGRRLIAKRPTMISLKINGVERSLERPTPLPRFLEEQNLHTRLIAVEHNGHIIPRDRFNDVVLQEGDTVEIVHMMAGGSISSDWGSRAAA